MNAAAPDIIFVRYSGRRGIYWFKQSYAMLSAHRGRWLMMLVAYYFLLGLVDMVPYIGQISVPLLKPVFAVGFLAAAWAQERGGAPDLKQLFEGFRSNLRALLPLGAFLLVGIMLAILASSLVDGGKLIAVLTSPPASPPIPTDGADAAAASGESTVAESVLSDPRVQGGMLFAGACGLPVLLALWFAPALVVFQDCGVRQALTTSLRAALANWKPIAVYGLLVFFWGGIVPGMSAALIAMVAPKSLAFVIALLAMLPYICLFTATLHISDYVAYRDIFHAGEAGPSVPAEHDALN
jgi:hypothetical protein